jgi:serine phosphatase RsbU (regulator of sigma subunit)
LLYSDGVTEARNGREQFGSERLMEAGVRLVSSGPGPSRARTLVTSLVNEVLDYQSGLPHDDIAILALSPP